ncbi:MAG TPA: PAS domain-containing protein, partial [Longimicrobiales bacterium]|nr:PAS domain-containing protein [Longimicrobiales bacterium]
MPNPIVPDAAGSTSEVADRERLVARNEALAARVRELEAERLRLLHGVEALDREQTEALRASDERYRMLFDSIDQGFCVVEVLFDGDDRPVDYLFVEVNAAFESQTGLVDATGRTMRSFQPDHEEHWFETYGRVARTGEPIRFENEAAALG